MTIVLHNAQRYFSIICSQKKSSRFRESSHTNTDKSLLSSRAKQLSFELFPSKLLLVPERTFQARNSRILSAHPPRVFFFSVGKKRKNEKKETHEKQQRRAKKENFVLPFPIRPACDCVSVSERSFAREDCDCVYYYGSISFSFHIT